jgi:HK97 family phage portal protein
MGSSQVTPQTVPAIDDRGYPSLAKVYRVGSTIYDAESVVHVPLLSLDGIKGLSPITLNRMGISLSLSQQQFAAKFYANGSRPSGVLEHPLKLGAEAATRLRENWSQVYAGSANAGKVAILEEGMKFNALTMPLEDAQFIETVRFSREQIAALFRVPPHMIGNLERATFSNIEQQSLEFAVYTLGPYLVKWEQAFANSLLMPSERAEYYFKFNMDALLRGDSKARSEAYAAARQWGWLSVNDIRELEDENPIPNGDIYLQPINMYEAGKTPPAPTFKDSTP